MKFKKLWSKFSKGKLGIITNHPGLTKKLVQYSIKKGLISQGHTQNLRESMVLIYLPHNRKIIDHSVEFALKTINLVYSIPIKTETILPDEWASL